MTLNRHGKPTGVNVPLFDYTLRIYSLQIVCKYDYNKEVDDYKKITWSVIEDDNRAETGLSWTQLV